MSSILDFIGAKDDGGSGDNWSYKIYKVPVKSSHQLTNTQFFTGQMTFLSPTNSVKALKENMDILHIY